MYHGVVPANGIDRPAARVTTGVSYPLADFLAEYPDDDACLDLLWRRRRFHRTRSRASYTCDSCGLHVHPMKGTVFERSTTPLRLWFYAIYLMASTGAEISDGQLARELGVSYRTARRIRTRIRAGLMSAAVTSAAAERPGSAADQPPPGQEQGSRSAPRGPAGSAGTAPAP